MAEYEQFVLICTGKRCRANGAQDLRKRTKRTVSELGAKRRVKLLKVECTGQCKQGPVLGLQPDNVWLHRATGDEADEVLREKLDPSRTSRR